MTAPAEDIRINAARRLLAEHHQPVAMSKGELWQLLARFQKRLVLVLDAYDGLRNAAAPDKAALAEIRAVLAAFDWEHDDRQYALEQIDRILEGDED